MNTQVYALLPSFNVLNFYYFHYSQYKTTGGDERVAAIFKFQISNKPIAESGPGNDGTRHSG
jgi:hypothetical protein